MFLLKDERLNKVFLQTCKKLYSNYKPITDLPSFLILINSGISGKHIWLAQLFCFQGVQQLSVQVAHRCSKLARPDYEIIWDTV